MKVRQVKISNIKVHHVLLCKVSTCISQVFLSYHHPHQQSVGSGKVYKGLLYCNMTFLTQQVSAAQRYGGALFCV